MPEDGTTRLTAGDEASPSGTVKDTSVPEPIWDDEDTKTFYECLPDLRAFVPAVLLGEAEPKSNEQSAKAKEKLSESSSEVVENQQTTEDTTEVSADSASMDDRSNAEQPKEKEEVEKEKAKDTKKEKGKEKDSEKKMEHEKEKGKSLDVANFERLLQRLPGCVSRDLIDQLTVEYCYLNSKTNRKKLVKALFNVPRTSLELLAYYSRMVATLASCMKDIPSMLVQMLEDEFNSLVHKKDQMNIETKIRNIRFIGELCKFKIVPAGLVFSCLKV
jgi:regulator of nonsense transcripts 2